MNPSNDKPAVLIFGASGGIGSALTRRLAAAGWRLALSGRNPERLEKLGAETNAFTQAAEATDARAVESVFDKAGEKFGRLDGVVNCCGSLLLKPAHLTTDENWAQTLATNLCTAFLVLRSAAARMMPTGGGSIVLMSSAVAGRGMINHEAIAAAKAGVAGLARSAAATYAHYQLVLFLSAMRHCRDRLRQAGTRVHYRQMDDANNAGSLGAELRLTVRQLQPSRLIVSEPGEWRVQEELKDMARELGVELEIRPDRHFICRRADFAAHVGSRKTLSMEFFYRDLRRRTGVLMEDRKPVGGQWNFDAENRKSFGASGPGLLPTPASFAPDATTREVMALVERRFARHPGSLKQFDWPVTPEQARAALDDFIMHRLPQFGRYQDAMWSGADEMFALPYLYHSRLSAALNLKLLDPRGVIAVAERAYHGGRVPLAGVEGFIRQILGWREYVRGISWQFMPGYHELNALRAAAPLPHFYWTGDTDLTCLREAIGQTLEYGYAHHIQRLMVTGLFALLLGVQPQAVHEWYLAVYVDAVEWVELPNTLGMSQYADGGRMASKPYVASGKYIQRMSNYCARCRFDPAKAVGASACPFTTLYWDFLLRHESAVRRNPRMTMQLKNLARLSRVERENISRQAAELKASLKTSFQRPT